MFFLNVKKFSKLKIILKYLVVVFTPKRILCLSRCNTCLLARAFISTRRMIGLHFLKRGGLVISAFVEKYSSFSLYVLSFSRRNLSLRNRRKILLGSPGWDVRWLLGCSPSNYNIKRGFAIALVPAGLPGILCWKDLMEGREHIPLQTSFISDRLLFPYVFV